MSAATGLLLCGTLVARSAEDPGSSWPLGASAAAARDTSLDHALVGGELGDAGPPPVTVDPHHDDGDQPLQHEPAPGADAAPAVDGGPAATATPDDEITTPAPASSGDTDAPGDTAAGPRAGAVPSGPDPVVQAAGAGTLSYAELPHHPLASTGRDIRYAVAVEDGLEAGGAEVAGEVSAVLTDPRGWQTKDGIRFIPVSPAEVAAGAAVEVTVVVASPTLTARMCAPQNTTVQQVSCWNGRRAVLNLKRWTYGSTTYGPDLAGYRTYLINHEVGHALGHGHVSCPAPGQPAPVMVQQTKSLFGCTPWSWPTTG